MSNISTANTSVVAQEQLFTELTAEESAVIEGGALLTIHGVKAFKAGADGDGTDELYIRMKTLNFDKKIWGNQQIQGGTLLLASQPQEFTLGAKVSLYDNDKWPNPDDFIGSFEVSDQPTNGIVTSIPLIGGGSDYDVYYSVA